MEALADGAAHFGQPRTRLAAAQGQIHIQVHAVVLSVTRPIISLPLPSEAAIRASLTLATKMNEPFSACLLYTSPSPRD